MRLDEAISLYLEAKRGEFTERTERQVRGTLERLPDVELTDLTEEVLRTWRSNLRKTNGQLVSAASANTYMDRVRAFLSYCEHKGWVPRNEARFLGALIEPAKLRIRMSGRQLDDMLEVAPNPRDRGALAVAREWLLRATEISMLRVGHIRLDDGMADVQIMKKRGVWSWDEMPITGPLADELKPWLLTYRSAVGILPDDAFLFPRIDERYNGPGRQLLYRHASPMSHPEEVVKRAMDAIGVTADRRGFHDVRRSMARLRYDALCEAGDPDPLGVVKALLHHEDRRTTEAYIGIDAARTRRNKVMRSAAWTVTGATSTSASSDTSGLAKVIPITS